MDQLPSPPRPGPRPRKAYKIAGPRTWALAREFYLAGMPAPEVARRLDVSEHNLRRKAWKEGWSRRQHAERVLDVTMPAVGGDRSSTPRLLDGFAAVPAGPAAGEACAAALPGVASEARDGGEADPLEAARLLLRRAAGAALGGRCSPLDEVRLAENLARGARALSDAEAGMAAERERMVDDVKAALEADPDFETSRTSPEEVQAMRDHILASFQRLREQRVFQPEAAWGSGCGASAQDDDPGYVAVEAAGPDPLDETGDDGGSAAGGLDGSGYPWPDLRRSRPVRLSEPAVSISGTAWPPEP